MRLSLSVLLPTLLFLHLTFAFRSSSWRKRGAAGNRIPDFETRNCEFKPQFVLEQAKDKAQGFFVEKGRGLKRVHALLAPIIKYGIRYHGDYLGTTDIDAATSPILIDVGSAHHSEGADSSDSLFFLESFAGECEVHALDINADSIAALLQKVKNERKLHRYITSFRSHHVGLGDTNTNATLIGLDGVNAQNTYADSRRFQDDAEWQKANTEAVALNMTAQILTFDTFRKLHLPENKPPFYIKIDTEGYESSVIIGMMNTLASGAAPVLISFEYAYFWNVLFFKISRNMTSEDVRNVTGDHQTLSHLQRQLDINGYDVFLVGEHDIFPISGKYWNDYYELCMHPYSAIGNFCWTDIIAVNRQSRWHDIFLQGINSKTPEILDCMISEAYRAHEYGVGLSIPLEPTLNELLHRVSDKCSNVEPMLSLKASASYNYACDIVLYTTILNDYDELPGDFSHFKRMKSRLCQVVLTDEYTQQKKGWRQGDTVQNWYVETVAESRLTTDPALSAHVLKVLAHRIFPHVQYSVYIDAKVRMRVNPVDYAFRHGLETHGIVTLEHEARANDLLGEFDATIAHLGHRRQAKNTSGDRDSLVLAHKHLTDVHRMRSAYLDELVLSSVTKYVPEASFIARNHKLVSTRAIECSWFLELLKFSMRDQLSFSKVVQRLGLGNQVFFIDALVWKNEIEFAAHLG